MWKYHQILLCLLFLWKASSLFHTHFTDFYVESVKILYMNPQLTFIHANVSLKRKRQEYPKVSLEGYLNDSLRNYDGDVKIYYSPLGNRRYILLPLKIERKPICSLMEYKAFLDILQTLQNSSNFPQRGDQNVQLCELFTLGHYYAHNFVFQKSLFPPYTPTGRYRMEGFAYQRTTKQIVQGYEFVINFV